MSTNREIARIFNAMADLLELKEVPWKPRAYRAGARTLENLGRDVRAIHREGGLEALERLPGIGEGLGNKIVEYLKTGRIRDHGGLKRSLPPGLVLLLDVPGLGPWRARKLHGKLGIRSMADLKAALQGHKVAPLPGFGEKSEQRIAESLGLQKPHRGRVPRRQALPDAVKLLSALGRLKDVERVEVAGSLRRKEGTVGDIDLLVVSHNPLRVMKAFTSLPGVRRILMSGPKKSAVVLQSGLQADLRVVGPESFGAALVYFTGDKRHNIELRRRAIHQGWKLNEYGLFDAEGKVLAGKDEEGVYRALGLKLIPPEERHGGAEFEKYALHEKSE